LKLDTAQYQAMRTLIIGLLRAYGVAKDS